MATAKTKATENKTPVDPTQYADLNTAALEIYKELLVQRRGLEESALASHAFALAKFFVEEAERIANGGEIRQRPTTRKSPTVKVWQHDPITGEALYDDYGRPVTVEMPGDAGAHSPNLPPMHPHNQRYFLALEALGEDIPRRYQRALGDLKAVLAAEK